MTKKAIIAIVVILIVLLLTGGAFWYFVMGPGMPGIGGLGTQTPSGGTGGFQPFGRTVPQNGGQSTTTAASTGQNANQTAAVPPAKIPVLRELSATPVGGYGSILTASSTLIDWVDRGRGNIYQADESLPTIVTLSNTLVPKIYQSLWNKSLTAFIGSLLQDDDSAPTTIYAQLIKQSTTTLAAGNGSASSTLSTQSVTPFELRGNDIPGTLIAEAISPDKSQVFMLMNENGSGVGYISNFNGAAMTRIFTTPLTQVNVDWPTAGALAITTKGSSNYEGYMYTVSTKTGIWKKILGPLPGLSTVMSHDGHYVLVSAAGNNNDILTSIYSVMDGSAIDAGIRTLADKCAWGNFYQDVVYCAVPSVPVAGTYPDDWYTGAISTNDKIWQVDAGTGEVHLIASPLTATSKIIDGFNLGLDAKDQYLFFMNKNDLSLWSLDLVDSQDSQ